MTYSANYCPKSESLPATFREFQTYSVNCYTQIYHVYLQPTKIFYFLHLFFVLLYNQVLDYSINIESICNTAACLFPMCTPFNLRFGVFGSLDFVLEVRKWKSENHFWVCLVKGFSLVGKWEVLLFLGKMTFLYGKWVNVHVMIDDC